MECWIRIHNCENWISNYKRIVDAWEDGGIRGIALGHLNFTQADGSGIRTYSPDPKIYESYGVSPPPEGPYDSEKEKKLHEILDDVASRGWQIMLFEDAVSAGGNSKTHVVSFNMHDPSVIVVLVYMDLTVTCVELKYEHFFLIFTNL